MLRAKFEPFFPEEKVGEEAGGVGSSTQQKTTSGQQNNIKIKEDWNKMANTPDGGVYYFQYTHKQLNNNNTTIHLKTIPMGNILIVHSTYTQDEKASLFSFEFDMNEYVTEYMTENDAEYKWKALQLKFKQSIIYTLIPSLQPPTPNNPPSSGPTFEIRGAVGDPLRSQPNYNHYPFSSPPRSSPYNVGHNDVFPSGNFGDVGGGMMVGPGHSMFQNYPSRPSPFSGDYIDDDDLDFSFQPSPNCPHIPQSPLPPPFPGSPHSVLPPVPNPHYDPIHPLDNKNKNKDKRSPFGPDPDHLKMPGGHHDWYI